MLTRFLIIFIFTYNCQGIYGQPDKNLDQLLSSTTIFFDQLKNYYESQPLRSRLYKSIDEKIEEYINKVKKSTILYRGKRQLNRDEYIRIFSGFEKTSNFDLPEAIDITFFVHQRRETLRWYAATLNTSGISLYQYQHDTFIHVVSRDVENGTRIVSHSSENATLLIIQRSNIDAFVFRLSEYNSEMILDKVQTVDTFSATYLAAWRGVKKIQLAVSSGRNITIFNWLGEHFDRIQTLKIGAKKIIPFQTGGTTMNLVAIDHSFTSILKLLPDLHEFIVVQRIFYEDIRDATTFSLERGHHGEYFLALAGKNSTIIYKQSKHRFVPFQEIISADKIRSMVKETAIFLYLLRNDGMAIYQYNGWKFVESMIKKIEVIDLVPIALMNKDFLALKTIANETRDLESLEERLDNKISQFNARGLEDESFNGKDHLFSGRTNIWIFWEIIWGRNETLSSLRERTKLWCQNMLMNETLQASPIVPQLKTPLRIERAYIQNLRVRQVNGQSIEKLVNLTNHLNKIISETREQETELKRYIPTFNPVFNNLEAIDISVNCTSLCKASKVETVVQEDFFKKLRRIEDVEQNLEFQNVTVSYAKNLPCPFPAPKFEHVMVDGLVNGISFSEFVENVLKTEGDQDLMNSYTFSELRVINAKIPLDVASNFTRQEIVLNSSRVDELTIISGDILLPLKNNRPTTLSGSITVPEARIKGFFDMRGKIDGPNSRFLSPLIEINEPLEIFNNFSFEDIKVVKNLWVNDVTRSNGKSFNNIVSNAIPLISGHMPVHLKFTNENVKWSNITIQDFPYKWLTKKNSGQVIISGHKNMTKPVIEVKDIARKNLPTPRLQLRVCSLAAISEGIREANLVIDKGSAKSVKAENVDNNSELSQIFLDSAKTLDEIPWNLKNLTGRVNAKKANITGISGMDFEGFKNSMARWIEPTRLKGPVKVERLKVDQLFTSDGFHIPLPQKVRNVEATSNFYIGKLNNIDFERFIGNVVKFDDNISLTNITFAGGLDVDNIFASKTSFSLQETISSGYLGSKEISGTLESQEIIVPNFLDLPSSDEKINIVVKGNAEFINEPTINYINDKNLKQLYKEVWLIDEPAKISAEYVEFKNVTFEDDLTILKSFDTPNFGPWSELENRLLSKTKSQEINVEASFNFIRAPNFMGSEKSHLRSNVSYLRDLEFNSLKNHETQVITNDWNFEKLTVAGKFELKGRLNGLNFSTDVVRKDVKRNVITGKKIVRDLIAQNIDGIKFDEFAANAMRKNNKNGTVVVKGWKNFRTIEMGDLRLEGTMMEQSLKNPFLKTGGQNLGKKRIFKGSVKTPSIVVTGLVNGIKLQFFVENQLRKMAPYQIIKTPMTLANNITILGNITIDGLWNGVDLNNFQNPSDKLSSLANKTSGLMNFAEGIEMSLKNRAIYWDKLELVKEYSNSSIFETPKKRILHFEGLGNCEMVQASLFCDQKQIFDRLPVSSSPIVSTEIINLSGVPLVASVTSESNGGIYIFRYTPDDKKFYKMAELRLPGIVEASLSTMTNSLWICLHVLGDYTTILRYELWSGFHEWFLPGRGTFLMGSSPTNELLIFRSDGVWKLGGLAGPRHIFRTTLDGRIDTFTSGFDYYVQLLDDKNVTTLFKTRYVGN